MQVFSLRPETMECMYRGWLATMCSGSLSRQTKELLALAVSKAGKCDYCTDSHLIFLQALGLDRGKAYDVERKLADADDLSDQERVTVHFAGRITADPRAVSEEDVAELADVWPQAEERAQVIAVMCGHNVVYRIANALGVPLEIPSALRRFEAGRRGAITFLARLTALSAELGERPLPARTPEENSHAFERLFGSQLGFTELPPGYRVLETCPEVFDGQLRVIEKSVAVVPRDRWMRIGLVVAKLTGCDYLSTHCAQWLASRGVDATDVIAASEGAGSSLSDAEECCLRFTRDITLHSHTIGAERIAELRRKGMSDGAILDLTYVGSVFNGLVRYIRTLSALEVLAAGEQEEPVDERVPA
jgi:uncharacterized peroxidase-related enzyme